MKNCTKNWTAQSGGPGAPVSGQPLCDRGRTRHSPHGTLGGLWVISQVAGIISAPARDFGAGGFMFHIVIRASRYRRAMRAGNVGHVSGQGGAWR
jgi:hypothetical protein